MVVRPEKESANLLLVDELAFEYLNKLIAVRFHARQTVPGDGGCQVSMAEGAVTFTAVLPASWLHSSAGV